MFIEVMKSKIHRVEVTQADLNYIGSVTIDEDLIDAANLVAHEKVQIVNVNNGERLETYVIKGERGSGVICLNGPAARKAQVGDVIIIISYASMDFEEAKEFEPHVIMPGKGKMQITGKLGDVMQESVKAAKSYIRSKSLDFGIIPPIFDKKEGRG